MKETRKFCPLQVSFGGYPIIIAFEEYLNSQNYKLQELRGATQGTTKDNIIVYANRYFGSNEYCSR